MAYEIKREDQIAIEPRDLSDAEAALIKLLANDLRVNAPREVGYGDTFEEAWSAVPARLEKQPERNASDGGTERPRRFA